MMFQLKLGRGWMEKLFYYFLFWIRVISKYQNEGFGEVSNSMFIENNLRVVMGVHCAHMHALTYKYIDNYCSMS